MLDLKHIHVHMQWACLGHYTVAVDGMISDMLCVRSSDGDVKGNPVQMQSTIIFNLMVLSQLANTCKAVIEVS